MSDYPKELHQSPVYKTWSNMKSRCMQKTDTAYSNYGGRGITVCDKWLKFSGFYEDMGNRLPGMTLDRIDNNKGYYKANCRWADRKTQARNTRNTDRARRFSYRGVSKTILEWAEESGIKRTTLSMRLLKYGMPIDLALTRKRG